MSTASKAQVLNLVEMVNYQDGAVVSRQVIKEEAGNITLFAFDQEAIGFGSIVMLDEWRDNEIAQA